MKTKRVWVIAGVAFLVLPESTGRADAGDFWCSAGWSWTSRTKIPVWIHPDLADSYMKHPDGTFWTDAELAAEVQFVIERFKAMAPSAMPPIYFAGFENAGTNWDAAAGNATGNTPGQYNIAIRPDQESGSECSSQYAGSPTDAKGLRIRIGVSVSPCTLTYAHWVLRWSETDDRTFGGTLAHELMHTLGFHHWDDGCNGSPPVYPGCTDNPSPEPQCCGTMDTHGLVSEYYEPEFADWDGFVTRYGGWENDGRFRRESSDALTWSTLGSTTFQSGPIWASTFGLTTQTPIAVTQPSNLYPHLWRWARSGGTFYDWLSPYSGEQFGPLGTAYRNSTYLYLWFMLDPYMTFSQKKPRYSYHPNSSTYTVVFPNQYAGRAGVTGTWDPKADKLIHVWRSSDNEIMLSLSSATGTPGTATTPVALTGDANKAAWTPSIVCGESSITYNCILVWATSAAGSSSHYHKMRWVQFYISGSTFNFGSVYENGYIMYGPPAVTYKGPASSSSAFVVTWHNPGQCYYTLRKSTATTVAFSSERSHCSGSSNHNGPPMIGGTQSNYAEAWTQFNTMD